MLCHQWVQRLWGCPSKSFQRDHQNLHHHQVSNSKLRQLEIHDFSAKRLNYESDFLAPIPPPPPPPPPKANPPLPNQLTPNNPPHVNGGSKSQENNESFEPPPMGCRPEIKIPPNPIAGLKRSPRPQPKDDYWIEEYRQEKGTGPQPVYSRSPAPMSPTEPRYMEQQQQQSIQVSSPVKANPPMSPPAPPPMPMSPPMPAAVTMRSESPVRYTPPHLSMSPIPSNLPPPINPIKTPISSPVKEDVQPTYQKQISQQQHTPYKVETPITPMEPQFSNHSYSEPEKARRIIMSTMPQMREQPQQQQDQEV